MATTDCVTRRVHTAMYTMTAISLLPYPIQVMQPLQHGCTCPSLLGDHRALEPPDPLPNSAVKRCIADGSVGSPHVRVGHRQAFNKIKCPFRKDGHFFIRNYRVPDSPYKVSVRPTHLVDRLALLKNGVHQQQVDTIMDTSPPLPKPVAHKQPGIQSAGTA